MKATADGCASVALAGAGKLTLRTLMSSEWCLLRTPKQSPEPADVGQYPVQLASQWQPQGYEKDDECRPEGRSQRLFRGQSGLHRQ